MTDIDDAEEQLSTLQDELHLEIKRWLESGKSPYSIAAILVSTSLQMYKAMLDEDGFEQMVNVISDSRHTIKKFDNRPIIN